MPNCVSRNFCGEPCNRLKSVRSESREGVLRHVSGHPVWFSPVWVAMALHYVTASDVAYYYVQLYTRELTIELL
jgi:hypothetical protein